MNFWFSAVGLIPFEIIIINIVIIIITYRLGIFCYYMFSYIRTYIYY